jgi:anti-sigma factor RsiW
MAPSRPSTERSDLLLHAYLDGELDVSTAVELERTIASDPLVANKANSVIALQKVLREKVPREQIPPYLKSRIEAALGKQRARSRPSWMLMAASVVAAIALSSMTTRVLLQAPPASTTVANELIDGHMRSLAASQPTDVVSSDGHVVKPWFNSKILQSPRVVDLAKDEFPLIGGRIDVVNKVAVPTLVYSRRRHIISLTAVALFQGETVPISTRPANGFNTVSWSNGDTAYWAISDLNENELNSFAKLFQSAP